MPVELTHYGREQKARPDEIEEIDFDDAKEALGSFLDGYKANSKFAEQVVEAVVDRKAGEEAARLMRGGRDKALEDVKNLFDQKVKGLKRLFVDRTEIQFLYTVWPLYREPIMRYFTKLRGRGEDSRISEINMSVAIMVKAHLAERRNEREGRAARGSGGTGN
jgi:hypothetical protein